MHLIKHFTKTKVKKIQLTLYQTDEQTDTGNHNIHAAKELYVMQLHTNVMRVFIASIASMQHGLYDQWSVEIS